MVKLKKDENGRWSCPSRNENTQRYHAMFYKHYDAIVYSYLPLSSMLFFNVAIVGKLVAAKCRKKTEGAVGSTALSKTSNSLTFMLIGVCLLFALLTTPYAVMYRLGAEVASYYFALWYQLIYLNHSINFFVYVIANNRFRKEVVKLFWVWEIVKGGAGGKYSYTSYNCGNYCRVCKITCHIKNLTPIQ